MDEHELMFELSHPGRLEALHLLSQKPHRLTDISKVLDLTTAEISRHLNRLAKAKLITKDGDRRYRLSPFGGIILSELSNLRFLTKHNQYFYTHDLSAIPDELLWLNSVSKCKIEEGILEIMSKVEDMSKNASEYVRVISDQLLRSIIDLTLQKAKEGVDIKLIYHKDVDVPDAFRSMKKVPLEVRLLDEVRFSMKLNEKIAGIALPVLSGKIDYDFVMISNDPQFHKWSEFLFDYYWEKAKPAF